VSPGNSKHSALTRARHSATIAANVKSASEHGSPTFAGSREAHPAANQSATRMHPMTNASPKKPTTSFACRDRMLLIALRILRAPTLEFNRSN
jgi:hypothetical protein